MQIADHIFISLFRLESKKKAEQDETTKSKYISFAMESGIGYEAMQGYDCSFDKCINCNTELGGGGEGFQ